MHKQVLILLTLLSSFLSGCSSISSKPVVEGFCPQTYNAATALLLGKMADLAYQEDKNSLQQSLSGLGYQLDSYVIQNDKYDVSGFIAVNSESIIVSFTGSEDIKDWLVNAQAWPVVRKSDASCGKEISLHSGFEDAVNSVAGDGQLLRRVQELQVGNKKVYVTGHSLGGALAVIFSYFAETGTPLQHIDGVYTFGQPLSGDESFQQCYDAKLGQQTFRYVKSRDIVPKIRTQREYRHVGLLLFLDDNDQIAIEASRDFSSQLNDVVNYTDSALEDHSMHFYLTGLEKNSTLNPFSCP